MQYIKHVSYELDSETGKLKMDILPLKMKTVNGCLYPDEDVHLKARGFYVLDSNVYENNDGIFIEYIVSFDVPSGMQDFYVDNVVHGCMAGYWDMIAKSKSNVDEIIENSKGKIDAYVKERESENNVTLH